MHLIVLLLVLLKALLQIGHVLLNALQTKQRGETTIEYDTSVEELPFVLHFASMDILAKFVTIFLDRLVISLPEHFVGEFTILLLYSKETSLKNLVHQSGDVYSIRGSSSRDQRTCAGDRRTRTEL